jgi:hypothetical protein
MPTFLTDKMVFIHVPKTGGTWVTQAVQAAGVTPYGPDPLGDQHYSAHGHADLADAGADGRLSVAFVRHPLDWWRSYWGHRMRAGWESDHAIDSVAASDDFNEFVERVVEHHPGHFDGIVERFVGYPTPVVDFVGRFEHLLQDTFRALQLSGEQFSPRALQGHPRENANDYSRFPALYRPDLAIRLAAAEHRTIERFYPEDPVPASLLSGTSGHERRAESERQIAHLESYVQGLEQALARTRREQDRLRGALASASEALVDTSEALQRLHTSRLLRYSRPARMFFYRARERKSELTAASRRPLGSPRRLRP